MKFCVRHIWPLLLLQHFYFHKRSVNYSCLIWHYKPKYYIHENKSCLLRIINGWLWVEIPIIEFHAPITRVDFYGNILLPPLYDPINIILIWKKWLNIITFAWLLVLHRKASCDFNIYLWLETKDDYEIKLKFIKIWDCFTHTCFAVYANRKTDDDDHIIYHVLRGGISDVPFTHF